MDDSSVRASRREAGVALLVTVLMLALMATIAFASLDTVMRDREVSGNTSRSQTALYAADAGVAASLQVLRDETTAGALSAGECIDGTVPAENLGNGASYGPDATAPTDKICKLAETSERCFEDTDLSFPFYYTAWDVRAQGQAAGSSVARVQATALRCHAFD